MLPAWLQIILALGGSALIGLVITDIYKGIKSKSKKHLDIAKQQKQEEMREVLQQELAPVKSEITEIKEDVSLVKNGLQKDLYIDLVNIYKQYRKKGFATLDEKRDYDSLYQSYHSLGQNGIADGMHKYIMGMPEIKKKTIKCIHEDVEVSVFKTEGD